MSLNHIPSNTNTVKDKDGVLWRRSELTERWFRLFADDSVLPVTSEWLLDIHGPLEALSAVATIKRPVRVPQFGDKPTSEEQFDALPRLSQVIIKNGEVYRKHPGVYRGDWFLKGRGFDASVEISVAELIKQEAKVIFVPPTEEN